MNYQGVVSNVSSFPFQDKKLWSFQLRGDKGIYYRTGEDAPRFEVGDFVNFEGKPGKQPNSVTVDFKSIQTKKGEAVREASGLNGLAGNAGSGVVNSRPDNAYWEAKDARIERQACRNSALELIKILLSQDAVKFGAKADKVDIIEKLLDHYTDQFIDENNGKKKAAPTADVENLDDTVPY